MYSAAVFGFRETTRTTAFSASSPRLSRPYFLRSSGWTSGPASGPSRRATPSRPSPRTRPRASHGATRTRGSRRIRFTFHVFAPDQTSKRRPSSLTTHTGVEAVLPSRLNVVRLMWRSRASAAKPFVSATAANLPDGTRLGGMAQAPVLPRGFELPLEPRLPRIGSVDAVALEERAAGLAKRSIKRDAKVFALDLAIRMMDLTTLEGQDTPGKVAALASKAVRPDPSDPNVPSVAAICVYPNLVPPAVARVAGSGVKVASVATAFPSGQSPLEAKLEEVRWVVENGADEVDMVIDRGAFLSGRYAKVYDEIVRVKETCGEAHLKVILEVAELGTYDNVRRASLLAMAAGADFIKTSTGKLPGAATLPVTLCMLEAIRDVHEETGRKVGMKPAGGIRQAKQAVQYLVQLHETLGPDWLTPDLYRLGASSLLNDVLMQLRKERTGAYQSPDYFTVD
jgi:deoxyribose-phosphate aldolase